jgi:hypothetical protein
MRNLCNNWNVEDISYICNRKSSAFFSHDYNIVGARHCGRTSQAEITRFSDHGDRIDILCDLGRDEPRSCIDDHIVGESVDGLSELTPSRLTFDKLAPSMDNNKSVNDWFA